jgi:hypothetical protein
MGLHNARAGLRGSQGGRRGYNAEGCKKFRGWQGKKQARARCVAGLVVPPAGGRKKSPLQFGPSQALSLMDAHAGNGRWPSNAGGVRVVPGRTALLSDCYRL